MSPRRGHVDEDHRPPPVEPVGESAGRQGEQQPGQPADEGDGGEGAGVAGDPQGDERQGDRNTPSARFEIPTPSPVGRSCRAKIID